MKNSYRLSVLPIFRFPAKRCLGWYGVLKEKKISGGKFLRVSERTYHFDSDGTIALSGFGMHVALSLTQIPKFDSFGRLLTTAFSINELEIACEIIRLTASSRKPASWRFVLGPLPPLAMTAPEFDFILLFRVVSSPSTSIHSPSCFPSSSSSSPWSTSMSASSSSLCLFRFSPWTLASISARSLILLESNPARLKPDVSSERVRRAAVRGRGARLRMPFLDDWEMTFL